MKRKGKMIVRRAALSRRNAVSRLLLLTLFLFSFVGGARADEPTPRRTPTMTKDIEGYGEGENHRYLIASPIEEVAPVDVDNLLSNDYDLYWFDHAPETDDGLEWRNYKVVGQENENQSAKYESGEPEEPEPEDASVTVNPDKVELDAGAHEGTLDLTYENLTVNNHYIQYFDANIYEIDQPDQPDWIEVMIAEKQGGGYEVSYHLNENEGNETRTAYFKVYANDNENNIIYSNLVTVTQGPIPYIAANGTTATCTNYTILGGSTSTSTTTLPGGWYVVTGSNVSYSAGLTFYDDTNDTHIILADGAKLSINAGDGCGISVENGKSLYIYGQTNSSGKLTTDYGEVGIYSYDGNIIINGGNISISNAENGIYFDSGDITINGGTVSTSDCDYGIYSNEGSITIKGGTVSTSDCGYGIYSYDDVTLAGGSVEATATNEGIYAYNGDIILAGGTVKASSYGNHYSNRKVKVASSLTYSDGTNTYLGTLTSQQLDAIKNTTLAVSAAKLTAKEAPDGYYWTTFYFGGTGFAIDSDENACAYTATYSNENNEKKLTLHKLGKVIPAGTAVIIVDNDESISMTTSTAGAENTVSNHLKGVDVSTPLASLGEGTFYVLGKVGNDFGFFEYTGTDLNMPARKAYLQLPVSAGRSLTMVLGEETGIVDADLKSASHESGILNPLQRGSYTLSGQRVAQPTKGLYIVNGKKRIMN